MDEANNSHPVKFWNVTDEMMNLAVQSAMHDLVHGSGRQVWEARKFLKEITRSNIEAKRLEIQSGLPSLEAVIGRIELPVWTAEEEQRAASEQA